MDERWQKIEQIFHAARELDGSARAAFLTEACGADVDLRDEVESLLAHESQAGSYLEGSPVTMAAKAFGKDEHSLSSPDVTLETGSMIAHYRVLEKIGKGGMGEVYRARDTKLRRDVALKILPHAMAHDAECMARLEREAQVLASLNHPNIAAIHGLEESNGIRALVIELVGGQTLGEKIVGEGSAVPRERKGLPCQDALPMAKQIAEALEYAHERGVIHRDLKPANVKITPEGTVKVLDFGLAKILTPQDSTVAEDAADSPTISAMATQPGTILGTAAYMSPEQAKGQRVDRRCDIWAFGCLLFEVLSGQRAFDGETISDVLAAVLTKEPDWAALPDTTPEGIHRLIRRCLQKDLRQRLQAIGEARITIEETLSGRGVPPVVEHGQDAHATKPLRRVLPWVIVGLLTAALITVVFLRKYAAPAPRSAMHFSAVTNSPGVQAQPALSPDGRSVAFVSNRDGHFDIYVGLARGGSPVQITHDPNLKTRPAWSPDGATLAYARLNHWGLWDIWEVPALGGIPRRVILNATDPAWSPDGHTLAYSNMANGGIWVSGISGENARQAVQPGHGGVVDTEPCFSPNGHELAFVQRWAGPYGELSVADLDSGKLRLFTHDNALALSPAWSPDGRFIFFASSRGGTINIWKITADGGKPEQITAGEGDDVDLDVSADGKRIVFGTLRQKIGFAQLDLKAKPGHQGVKVLTTDQVLDQIGPTFSPDGKHLAYFIDLKGAENEEIWVSDADGSNAAPLVQDGRRNIFPAWTPDGNGLIYDSVAPGSISGIREYRRVSMSGGAPQVLMAGPDLGPEDVGRDGRLLFLGAKGQAETFDPRDGKKQILGTLPAHAWSALRWSPDERSIAYFVWPTRQDDRNAGLWVNDFKNPPRQIFHGWIVWFARAPGNEIYLLEGKPDLNAVLWKVNWNGKGLARKPWTLAMPYDIKYYRPMVGLVGTTFDASPDGRHLVFQTQQVLEENIGMIENGR